MNTLKDKAVLVTGGGRGIGQSIAFACAQAGARVCVTARSQNEIDSTVAEIKSKFGTQALALRCDVSKSSDVENAVRTTERELGPIYGLVCAAGIYGPIGPFDETSFDEWMQAIEINLFGTARIVHQVLPGMKKRREGRILLMSGGGQGGMPNFSSYVTGKGAIARFNETMGSELAPFGIYVNAIAPGAVNTKFLDELLAAGEEKVGKDFYQKSLKQKSQGGVPPEKASELALFLLSDAAKGLSGKLLSAVWDNIRDLKNPEELSKSDIFTMRRVVDLDGGTRPPK